MLLIIEFFIGLAVLVLVSILIGNKFINYEADNYEQSSNDNSEVSLFD